MQNQPLDSILINGLKLDASIGCLDWEKTLQQKLVIDLELDFDCSRAGQSDQIQDALDYAALTHTIKEVATSKHFNLVEHLATTLCQAIFAAFAVSKITITVSKPQVMTNVAAAGVRITRYAPA